MIWCDVQCWSGWIVYQSVNQALERGAGKVLNKQSLKFALRTHVSILSENGLLSVRIKFLGR